MQKNYKYPGNFEEAVKQRQRILFGERYVGVSLSDVRCSDSAQVKISNFINKKKNFLVYCGNPGIGKTYLCAAMIDWAMREFDSFRYWNESELLKRVRSSIDQYKGDYLDALKLLIDDDLIFLDDVGSCGMTEWRTEILFDLIDERYCSMKPTIITSNFNLKELQTIFPARVASRLLAKENEVIEIMYGPDLRKKPEDQKIILENILISDPRLGFVKELISILAKTPNEDFDFVMSIQKYLNAKGYITSEQYDFLFNMFDKIRAPKPKNTVESPS